MSKAIAYAGLLFTYGHVDTKASEVEGQTRNVLDMIDAELHEAGTCRSQPLSVNVWLFDMDNFDRMNAVLESWLDKNRPPARATNERPLADSAYLVEISVVAALSSERKLLTRTAFHAETYFNSVCERHVGAQRSSEMLRASLGGALPESGDDEQVVIDDLARAGEIGAITSQSPRYLGFVTGGTLPVATAADWLVSADQNAQLFVMSPLASVVEEIASTWLKELFGLPPTWSVGFVTGAQMATFAGLAAARRSVLRRVGWDVERDGLFGAPPVDLAASEESHRTISVALRLLDWAKAK